jgi:multidrug transporter EmrE-like cation transporter
MKFNIFALIILAIFCNVFASILLKKASIGFNDFSQIILRNMIYYAGAIFMYAGAFIFYATILRYLPVSKAYIIITFGAQIGLIVIGFFFFGERFSGVTWIGLFLVLIGLILIGRNSSV